jgi:large subunit ribosomal protein L3
MIMAKFILGKKMGMTQKFLEDGTVVATTVIKAGPCTVTQVKGDKEAYKAVQVGFDNKRAINKPLAGHLKGLANFRHLVEFRVNDTTAFERGKVFDVTSFQVGDKLKVSATSKGKGFQGVVKRHGFHGSLATHGHKDQLRMPGSIGATAPARVFKGTRMAGHMGTDRVTVSNLKVVAIDVENNLLYLKGAVPGHRHSLVSMTAEGELTFVTKTETPQVTEVKTPEVEAVVNTEEVVANDSAVEAVETELVSQEPEAETNKAEETAQVPAEELAKTEIK